MSILTRNIQKLRVKHNYSQAELAKAIGMQTHAIGAWEEGRSNPRYPELIKLCRLFNHFDIYKLLTEELKWPPNT